MIAARVLEADVRGVEALNRAAQARWDDDGGAPAERPTIDGTAFAGANDRTMLLDHLEVANRYFAESEHRIARQQNLIAKLRAKRQTTLSAVEFLRSLQASRVMHRTGRGRLQRALAVLDAKLG